jgi:hypothetical protein
VKLDLKPIETKRRHAWRAGPCEFCGEKCEKRQPGDPLWREHAESKFLAQANGRDVKYWPAPCEICGVEYKLTPAGRWHIEHAYPHGKPGVFATQPMEAPREVQDPLLDGGPRPAYGKPKLLKAILKEMAE